MNESKNQELAIRFGLAAIKAVGMSSMDEVVMERKKNGLFTDIYNFSERLGSKIVNKKSIDALSKSGSFDAIHKNRRQIVESSEILSKYASFKEEEKNSNQMSLFNAKTVEIENPTLADCQDWGKQDKLQKEFEAFGFFTDQHPMDDYQEDLKRRGVILSNTIEDEDILDNSIIKISGVIVSSKHRSGPKGRYAYLSISDPMGIVEISIFNEELITNYRDLIADGSYIVSECLVKKDGGGIRILVKNVYDLKSFISSTKINKTEFRDIKQQPARRDFEDYKYKKKDNSDILAYEIAYKKKIEDLKNKEILGEVRINIDNRDAMIAIKGFLSQRIAPKEFSEYTKVIICSNDGSKKVEIELSDGYLIDEMDMKKILNIT